MTISNIPKWNEKLEKSQISNNQLRKRHKPPQKRRYDRVDLVETPCDVDGDLAEKLVKRSMDIVLVLQNVKACFKRHGSF